ncbi:MAG TPA: hypothetical protein VFR80_14080 [Pyrinomonadaceae bacterium]|nr:hypothetical protein [Pyrinomonadaceae bacterium]
MKAKTTNPRRLDILGNVNRSSDREILNGLLKQWRQRLGYCSIFAAIPAMLASPVSEARADETKKPEVNVAGRGMRLLDWPNKTCSSPALLKRQSKFLLPHQRGNFALLTALAGNDDCPGRSIPGGTYTAAAPYIDSGDTSGANNTVRTFYMYSFGYQTLNSHGPDHIYSFILTGRGPNPRIEVSTTSGTYKPLVYVLQGGSAGSCPAGLGRDAFNGLVPSEAVLNGAAILSQRMNFLPLNVPLHLFVDSAQNDATGSGPYTLRMQDVTISSSVCSNPIDCPEFFLYQHYIDFLGRAPDPPGMAGWLSILNNCLAGNTSCDFIHVSSAFFRSPEFQERGYFLYRFYPVAFGRKPDYNEFAEDRWRLSGFLTDAQLEQAKVDFIAQFMSRPAFVTKFNGLSNSAYVDSLLSTAGITHASRSFWILALGNGTRTRAQVLREIAESSDVYNKYYNQAFVVMQYFGYLHRQPDALYLDWLAQLDATGDYRSMISGFINSIEYRARFAP